MLALGIDDDPDQNFIQLSYYDEGQQITFLLERDGTLFVRRSDKELEEVAFS
jgi:hypothetical protein